MKRKYLIGILAATFILASLISCKKDNQSGAAGCWQCNDLLGNNIQVVCGENEQSAFDKSGIINGQNSIENFRIHCKKK